VKQDDSSLVERCIKRDPLAWAELVTKYSDLIALSIRSRLRKYSFDCPQSDVDDIRQNVLTSVWKDNKLATIRNRTDISYWLAIVSGNAAIDHVRRAHGRDKLRTVSIHERIDEEGVKELVEILPSGTASPKDEAVRKEVAESLEEALGELTAQERLFIKLSLSQKKTHQEISEITRTPLGTVSSTIQRSKEKLKKSLKKYLQEF
jgi:RNA polymerase sigma-70 factor (ECF subfamily)